MIEHTPRFGRYAFDSIVVTSPARTLLVHIPRIGCIPHTVRRSTVFALGLSPERRGSTTRTQPQANLLPVELTGIVVVEPLGVFTWLAFTRQLPSLGCRRQR